jgi:hypothetical protein
MVRSFTALMASGVNLSGPLSEALDVAIQAVVQSLPISLLFDSSALNRLHSQLSLAVEMAYANGHQLIHVKTAEETPEAQAGWVMAKRDYQGICLELSHKIGLPGINLHERIPVGMLQTCVYQLERVCPRVVTLTCDAEVRGNLLLAAREVWHDGGDVVDTFCLALLSRSAVHFASTNHTSSGGPLETHPALQMGNSTGVSPINSSFGEDTLHLAAAAQSRIPEIHTEKELSTSKVTTSVRVGDLETTCTGYSKEATKIEAIRQSLEKMSTNGVVPLPPSATLPPAGSTRECPQIRRIREDVVKNALQHYTITTYGVNPTYTVTMVGGKWHAEVILQGVGIFSGDAVGQKISAEKLAAKAACDYLSSTGYVFPSAFY